jgi:hypothetical protein
MRELKMDIVKFTAGFVGLCISGLLLAGCQPASDPPPDLVKTQREALNKAKAVEGQLQQRAEEARKATAEQTEK